MPGPPFFCPRVFTRFAQFRGKCVHVSPIAKAGVNAWTSTVASVGANEVIVRFFNLTSMTLTRGVYGAPFKSCMSNLKFLVAHISA
jgi:hypothetical protein